jgi:glutaredoxin
MKLLIIGHGRHGKDTVAEMIRQHFGLEFESSSQAAADIFIYKTLKDKYGYKTSEECYEDRSNHRAEWHDLICDYNKADKARLAKAILENADVYVGMRSNAEVEECINQGLFTHIIGVYDPRRPLEPSDSFDINIWDKADIIIPNAGDLWTLRTKVYKIVNSLMLTDSQIWN